MNNLRNRVQLIGHLGMNPEIKTLEKGTKLARFSLATNDTFKNAQGEKITETEWHNIVLWRAQAEFAEKYLKKGFTIYVEGKLRTRSWEDKDKVKRYSVEIVADTLTVLNGRREDHNGQAHPPEEFDMDSHF